MEKGTAVGLVLLALAIVGLVWVVNGAWSNWQTELKYDREVGGFYEYADRASDAPTKLMWFNKYVDALKTNGLDQGYNSMFFQNQPTANLANEWKTVTSIQKRLQELNSTDPTSMSYQMGIQEISTTEFCWFPTQAFYQGYALKNGAWGDAFWPPSTENACVTSSSSHSSTTP